MPRKRSSFINVNPFPLLFYEGRNQLNGKLIEKINGLVPKPNLEEMIEDLIQFEFEEEEE